ncbi:MAG: hypothetical protein UZ17_ACD001002541 [Acidobacteria bacterium OLB17]|nr:MAG: hypothetical protein UZ17_ACD001002541 [Acidobacteria bacterium OLB17]
MSLRFGGDGTSVFSLDATDLRSETETPMGAVPVIRNGKKQSDGSLVLSTNITLVTPNGAMTLTTNEHWVLSADGKTLTVKRDLISPRGTTTDTFVYSKS